ncbi:LacI family DNA-binding transcriptional regulator [Herbiconiux flava]|uniref:DNA-binding LacI/PurR family transcriptional regulator n=1 Tax=Herbiconiux flava TaxID=881268 RepID=A0A852SU09_9MICO|nr:LacI family DNA-binding transcriptional regulator [Herbiconiux flava]NYD72205.1 DNA-binding LacI/PurR family transcriptional regulator [Herbiconiux flava]GLK17831.1 LacI family transcriptional regulator [Herbiconiux flava]
MAITLHDVARRAGVSIKTVSNVINDFPHIRPETRARVLAAIEELDYRPNLTARGLRSGRSGAIGLIIPDLRNAYFAELAGAVMTAAHQRGLYVLIEQISGYDKESELAVLRGPRMQMVDGILHSVLTLDDEDAGMLDIPTPLVLLGDRIYGGPTDHVTMPNVAGARAATQHLIGLGCRRVLAFGAHQDEVAGSAALRLRGYLEAIEAAGLPVRPELIVDVHDWHRFDGAEAMRAVIASGLDFDGVVAFNDPLALGALRVVQEAGLRVPDDVAIIGFDDIDETRYSLPTLSTIDPGRDEIAEVAVGWLVERIEAPRGSIAPREHETQVRLLKRESTTRS